MNKIRLSITRNPKMFALSIFFGLTTMWALIEPFVSFYITDINKYWFLVVFILISILIAIIKMFPKISIKIELKNTNTVVNIKFGNLFDENNNIAIPVNEYFDSELGKPVSTASLHGILINKILEGKSKIFDKAVASSLSSIPYILNNRDLGKNQKYPIGTTATLKYDNKKYLLFAVSETSEEYEAHTNPSLMLLALNGLLTKARSECNGYELNIPLVGAGLSRSGIPPKYLVELILISILKSTKENEITNTINIIIHDSMFEKIDLNEIKRKWN